MERGPGTGGEAALQAGPGPPSGSGGGHRGERVQPAGGGGLSLRRGEAGLFCQSPGNRGPAAPGGGRSRLRPGLRPPHAAAGLAAGPDQRRSGHRGISLHRLGPADAPGAHRPGGAAAALLPPQRGGGAAPGGGQLPAPVPGDHGVAGAGGGGGRDGVPVWADRPAAGPGSELWGGGPGVPQGGEGLRAPRGAVCPPCPGRERRPGRGGGALRGPGGPSVPIPPVPQRRGHAHRPAAEPSALGGGGTGAVSH